MAATDPTVAASASAGRDRPLLGLKGRTGRLALAVFRMPLRLYPEHRFLADDEAAAAATDFRRRHPWRLRLVSAIRGWGDLRSDDGGLRCFVQEHPFVSLRPAQ